MDPSTQHIQIRRFDKWWKDLSLCKLLAWQATILVSQMTAGFDVTVVGSFQSMKPWVRGSSTPFCRINSCQIEQLD